MRYLFKFLGRLLNQITSDMVAKQMGMLNQGKKIKLYSAHDFNVNALIYALGVTEFERPYYCSAVILEMYSDEKNNYYVQVSLCFKTVPLITICRVEIIKQIFSFHRFCIIMETQKRWKFSTYRIAPQCVNSVNIRSQ